MEEKSKGIIYRIINNLTGQKYLGKSIRGLKRIEQHFKYPSYKQWIDRDIKEYGWDNFNCEVIDQNIPEYALNQVEKIHIEHEGTYVNPLHYNRTPGGDGNNYWLNKKRPEHSKLMSGENNPNKRPEVREKLKGEYNHNFNHDYVYNIVKAKNVFRWANIPFTKKDIGELLDMTKYQIGNINRELAIRGLTWEDL
jgi:hypothetical protein